MAEESARALVPGPLLSSAVFGSALADTDLSARESGLVTRLAAGETTGTWSVDADGRSGTLHLVRTAGGGPQYVLRGRRRFVPDAGLVDWILTDAFLGDGSALVLVPTDDPRCRVRRLETIDLTRSTYEVTFDDLIVPEDRMLAGRDARQGRRQLQEQATMVQCAESLGGADRALEMTVRHLGERIQFGQVLGTFQALKHRCADLRIELEAARMATRYGAWAVARHRPDCSEAVRVAKAWVGPATSHLVSEALQLHGGIGFTWEHDLHFYMRMVKFNELLLGSPAWHARALGRQLLDDAARADSTTAGAGPSEPEGLARTPGC